MYIFRFTVAIISQHVNVDSEKVRLLLFWLSFEWKWIDTTHEECNECSDEFPRFSNLRIKKIQFLEISKSCHPKYEKILFFSADDWMFYGWKTTFYIHNSLYYTQICNHQPRTLPKYHHKMYWKRVFELHDYKIFTFDAPPLLQGHDRILKH